MRVKNLCAQLPTSSERALMDPTDLFAMQQSYPQEDFNFQVSQVMQGFTPLAPPSAAAAAAVAAAVPTPTANATTAAQLPPPPSVPMVATTTTATSKPAALSDSSSEDVTDTLGGTSMAGMLDARALATGPASRRRGLAYARHVKAVAREEFKEKRRRELEASGEGDRTKRRKKNDTSMTEKQKYQRRLAKNQDSAAAARYSQDAYLANLESQCEAYDADMTMMENEVRRAKAERDEYARLNAVFREHTRNLEVELQRYREAISAQAKVQAAAPVVDKQTSTSAQIQFDQIVDALYNGAQTPTPIPAPIAAEKRLMENDLLAAFTSAEYTSNGKGLNFVANAPAF